MDPKTSPSTNNRIGMHYFPDTEHYRDTDIQTWLPRLQALGVSWLTLTAPTEWIIPENFIGKLVDAGIEPILHFHLSIANPSQSSSLELNFENYAKWGVRYAVFFDQPNSRSAWSVSTWTQEDLVERFLDRFIPYAEQAIQYGLTPVFPPLEPGGNYWDTSFLRSALTSLQRRNKSALLDKLALSAYAWTGEHSLNWGAGGPQRWPGARPYFTPQTEEDQRGFRIFDWYLSISEAVLGKRLPIMLFGLSSPSNPNEAEANQEIPADHAVKSLLIARLLNKETISQEESLDTLLEPVADDVIAGNFWVLAAAEDAAEKAFAWYPSQTEKLPVVDEICKWHAGKLSLGKQKWVKTAADDHPIQHYLLLPMYEWGIADWYLDIIRPFVKKFQPTVGFSVDEAAFAEKVTVIGNTEQFSEQTLDQLRTSGCLVERINGDGTQIASLLAER